eukprot:5672197-Heterocapsa_arctica.AAC.1
MRRLPKVCEGVALIWFIHWSSIVLAGDERVDVGVAQPYQVARGCHVATAALVVVALLRYH